MSSNVSIPQTLDAILRENGLYDDLHQILTDNDIDLEMLRNDVPKNEIDQFCTEFELSYKQKLKFRKLMRIVYELQSSSNVTDPSVALNNVNDVNSPMSEGMGKTTTRGAAPIDPSYEVKYDPMIQIAMQRDYEQQRMEEMLALKKGRDFIANKDKKPTHKMEVVLVGDSGVGKTSLMRKYVAGIFSEAIAYSIGVDSMVQIEKLHNNSLMEITVRDTAGIFY